MFVIHTVVSLKAVVMFFFQLKNETLENVSMVTSPTSEKVTESEVKVSGSCGFNTTLPPEEGTYEFFVSVSPGGHHFGTSDKRFTAGNYIIVFYYLVVVIFLKACIIFGQHMYSFRDSRTRSLSFLCTYRYTQTDTDTL